MKEGYEIALTVKPQRFLIAPRCCGLHVWPPFSSDTRPREIGNECLLYHGFPSKFAASSLICASSGKFLAGKSDQERTRSETVLKSGSLNKDVLSAFAFLDNVFV